MDAQSPRPGSDPSATPRDTAAILADLQALEREDDRLELRAALIRQNLKAAEARLDLPDAMRPYLDRAEQQLRKAG